MCPKLLRSQKAQSRMVRSASATTATSAESDTSFASAAGLCQRKFSSSPFKSFVTTGLRVRSQHGDCNDFAYHLSKDERHFVDGVKTPMKKVPDTERELLQSGQREAYLTQRYEQTPQRKYNYPEATSWRIGWFHNPLYQHCAGQ